MVLHVCRFMVPSPSTRCSSMQLSSFWPKVKFWFVMAINEFWKSLWCWWDAGESTHTHTHMLRTDKETEVWQKLQPVLASYHMKFTNLTPVLKIVDACDCLWWSMIPSFSTRPRKDAEKVLPPLTCICTYLHYSITSACVHVSRTSFLPIETLCSDMMIWLSWGWVHIISDSYVVVSADVRARERYGHWEMDSDFWIQFSYLICY